MATWSTGQSLKGAPGAAVRNGTGAPSTTNPAVQFDGDFYIATDLKLLHGPRASGSWPAGVPFGAAAVPNDLAANSLIVAPVSGDANAVQILLNNGSGASLFKVDASGNLTAATASVASLAATGVIAAASASITGSASATRFVAQSPGSASNPLLQYTANNSGTTFVSGVYSETNYGQWYEVVGGFVTRSVAYLNGRPQDQGAGAVTHTFNVGSGIGANAGYKFTTGNGTAFTIFGNSGAAFQAALSIGGITTSAGVTLSSGALTFADGTSLSSAVVSSQAAYAATSTGTASAPAHAYTGAAKGAGLYFDANGNDLFSVNGFKSLYSTAASGAASGASGWAIASTLGSGSPVLQVFGAASTTTPVASLDGAGALSAATLAITGVANTGAHTATGLITAPNITLGTAGKLTFGDGTVMSTAASGSGGSAGPQLRYGTGAPTTTNPSVQNDGDFWLQSDQSMLYGARANGVWPSTPVSLIGPTGPSGPAGMITRSIVYAGTFWGQSSTANTVYPMVEVVQSGSTVGQTMAVAGMFRAGSVTGFSLNQVGSVSGSFTITLQKNGTTFATFSNVGSGTTSTKPFTGTIAAGTYTFAAGDGIGMSIATSGSGNMQAFAHIEITTN